MSAVTPAQQRLDERFMRLALAIGRRNLGRTAPNPSVGAVVMRHDGETPVIVATGVTAPGGRPHGERIALDRAGEAARGATLYVTLEPCSHHGRTTPCADAIVAAGIGRVVSGLVDPDPRVSGQGHARLRDAGIAVTTNVLSREARRVHRGHILRVAEGRPMVTVKLARTADGFAAREDRHRLKITGRLADRQVHLLRARADAIMIGAGTAIADDPLLTVRLPGLEAASPIRVVLDSDLGFRNFATRMLDTTGAVPLWAMTTAEASTEAAAELVARGADVLRVPAAGGRIDLHAALALLAERGVTRLFCEGGPQLADALAAEGLVDEAVIITGPDEFGGAGEPAIRPALAAFLAGAERVDERMAGLDRIETYERSL